MKKEKKKLKYITKRLVARKADAAFKEGAKEAMEMNGYVLIIEDGWLVEKYADGSIKKLEEIEKSTSKLVLD